MKLAMVCFVVAMAITSAGSAQPASQRDVYRVLPGSSLGFTTSYEGEPFEGRFTRFTPVIEFDPKQLANARFDVRIDLSSADTSNADRDEVLLGEGFFNTRKSAQARYTSQRFRALGGNRYVADGTLTLNGVSKPVPLSFTWQAGANTVLVGSATLKRLDFAVGTGEWNDIELLPNEVTVKTRLVLAATTAKP